MASGVYLVGNFQHRCFKVGKTKNLKRRLKAMETDFPFEIRTFHFWETPWNSALERYLHIYLSDKRIRGEWFKLTAMDIDACEQEVKKFFDYVKEYWVPPLT